MYSAPVAGEGVNNDVYCFVVELSLREWRSVVWPSGLIYTTSCANSFLFPRRM